MVFQNIYLLILQFLVEPQTMFFRPVVGEHWSRDIQIHTVSFLTEDDCSSRLYKKNFPVCFTCSTV